MTSSYSHCSGCGSWVVDREFVIWVSPCLMVVIHQLRICDMASPCWFRRARWRDMVLGWLCSVVLGYGWLFQFLGWRDMVLGGCFTVVLFFGFDDEETEKEMRDKRDMVLAISPWYGFWVRQWRDRDERWETEERESNKILLFFYNTYYNAILCLELHCI